ncbi:sensor histidine kinase [Amycolatopsis sp.]|uniref:sensor histidine kinase n=1 Tax=Amycolatopsis sp. TaxID=37632 RepID=UPI002D7E9846|nr:histidine kinase [Amycolatopsis sp.]HET6706994.1 histidine kinase [Amycolatopsis sp.]
MITSAARISAGVGIGGLTGLVEILYVLLSAPLLVVPATRRAVLRGAYRLATFERFRMWRFQGQVNASDYDGARAFQYLSVRWLVGLLGLGVWGCLGVGVAVAVIYAKQLFAGRAPGGEGAGTVLGWLLIAGLAMMAAFLCAQGISGVAALDLRLAGRFFTPSSRILLERRMFHLMHTRAEVVEAVNDERRRIERALHDGVQQRLVALGLLLGRARRTGDADLVRQAHEEAQIALRELREVSWLVYPIALDDGLDTALESLAERATIPVEVRYLVLVPPSLELATVIYFVASESVTNAAKHSGATSITIDVRHLPGNYIVEITDNGSGGAEPAGTGGLIGLARRVAAADGEFTVDSPHGGPTVVRAVLPCE